MAAQQAETITDLGAVERLSERFAEVFMSLDVGEDLFAPNVFFDLNMPVWRFQLQGREAFGTQLRSITRGDERIDVLRTMSTVAEFVTEHEEHQDVGGQDFTARRLWLCEVRGGQIVDAVGYCSGRVG